eukprot:GHVT01032245.1.p1 GENE.GHVT01032245.1~~GHVT01032245.1.p1  ORF type:complete len:107 (+),score=5.14 GHVT01032245.1:220-540(+)
MSSGSSAVSSWRVSAEVLLSHWNNVSFLLYPEQTLLSEHTSNEGGASLLSRSLLATPASFSASQLAMSALVPSPSVSMGSLLFTVSTITTGGLWTTVIVTGTASGW